MFDRSNESTQETQSAVPAADKANQQQVELRKTQLPFDKAFEFPPLGFLRRRNVLLSMLTQNVATFAD